jgi:hypothetical protein
LLEKFAVLVSDGVIDEFQLKRRQISTVANQPSTVVFTINAPQVDSARISRFVNEYWNEWTGRARFVGVDAVLTMRKM